MNVYYEPAAFCLEQVYHADAGESYEFDKLVIWRRKLDGVLVYAADHGCSCPVPFEDETLETLEVATPEAVREWFDYDGHRRRGRLEPGECEKALQLFEVKA